MKTPRPEYPRPQFVRPDWLCLNGEWQFEIDAGDSGLERGLRERELQGKIMVPFCPESKLSGVGNTDFMPAVWYRREVAIPKLWKDRRVLLHFQAVDYDATVWVNGKEVGRHRGGFTPFTCNLNGVVKAGQKAVIVVRARDYHDRPQPRGKQCPQYANMGCLYTRTTGIWQTVWLEPVPESALQRPRLTPDVGNSLIRLDQPLSGFQPGMQLRAALKDEKGVISQATCAVADFSPRLDLAVPEKRRRLWAPEDPFLYDVEVELLDAKGKVLDRVESYAGLRSVTLDGFVIRLNGKAVFQRLVLDQGFYADGILTAPSDEALKADIVMSMEAGFNGARLHQKVFEERFLYHADKLGYLVWGEFGDWGSGGFGPDHDHQKPGAPFITQWLEALQRDYSHPAIVGWCPLNETWQRLHDRITDLDDGTRGMFLATKAMDTSRPVLDTSGYSHRVLEADIYDSHDYEQDPEKFQKNHAGLAEGKPFVNQAGPDHRISVPYGGQPYFVSEFGGIWWNPKVKPGDHSWGYGRRPETVEEFYDRFAKLCAVLLDDPRMFGYCYTQLTDVFQEQNGIYTFEREKKFDMERVRKAQQRKAAVEKL
jgi:beta-galactosidase/beta-glucuronidase